MNTPPDTPYDLVIHAGRVVCPANGLDGPGAVAVRGDRIAAVLAAAESAALPPDSSCETLSFPNGILLPGLIDAHAHPALSGSKYGIAPDTHILPYGSTTLLSQGRCGRAQLGALQGRNHRGQPHAHSDGPQPVGLRRIQ